MKKLLSILTVLTLSFSLNAQVKTPAPSPASKLEQKVGLTDVTIEYSRPGVKGRKIFGDLIEYGKVWRTGANSRTKITFSDNVFIDGKELKAGTYAIFTTPGEKMWDVFFYTEHEGGGAPKKWDDSKVALKTTAKPEEVPFNVETLTFDINDIKSGSARLELIWEKTYFGITFQVPTDNKVLTSINDALNGSPTSNDYYAAAVYYLEEGKDLKQAKTWIDEAFSGIKEPKFWQLRKKSLIYAATGDSKGAIKAAKQSLAAATEAGNDAYIKENTESLKEWGAM